MNLGAFLRGQQHLCIRNSFEQVALHQVCAG